LFAKVDPAPSDSKIVGYKYTSEREQCSYIFAGAGEQTGKPWRVNQIHSDAEFVCWKRVADEFDHLILCNGSFAVIDEQLEIRCRESVTWAEAILKDGLKTVLCSDPAAILNEADLVQRTANATTTSET
jgi:hypothetical protein